MKTEKVVLWAGIGLVLASIVKVMIVVDLPWYAYTYVSGTALFIWGIFLCGKKDFC